MHSSIEGLSAGHQFRARCVTMFAVRACYDQQSKGAVTWEEQSAESSGTESEMHVRAEPEDGVRATATATACPEGSHLVLTAHLLADALLHLS